MSFPFSVSHIDNILEILHICMLPFKCLDWGMLDIMNIMTTFILTCHLNQEEKLATNFGILYSNRIKVIYISWVFKVSYMYET